VWIVLGLALTIVGLQVWANIHFSTHALVASEYATNRSIARVFADRLRSIGHGTQSTDLYNEVRELGSLNPGAKLYILNERGVVVANPKEYGKLQLPFVDLRPIRRFLSKNLPNDIIYGDDPLDVRSVKPISVAPISFGGKPHFVYVTVGDRQNYSSVERALNFTIGAATALFSVLLISFVTCWICYLSRRRLRSISSGVAALSHDLRRPLSAIQGNLETLLESGHKLTHIDSQRFMSVALRSTKSAANLVNDIHHLSAIEVSGQKLQEEAFSLSDLVMDLTMAMKPQFDEKRISLLASVPPRLPMVMGHLALIERLIGNLLDNALRYTDSGGSIHVALEGEQNRCRITVSDTGCGIEEKDLPNVQKEFVRGFTARNKSGGTGLGLAIARRIAETHGSELKILTRPGEGTAVIFDLRYAVQPSLEERRGISQSVIRPKGSTS